MTQKLIKVSVCDVAGCGREIREPETTNTITLSVIKQGENVVSDIHNGAQFEICDECMNTDNATYLRMSGVVQYLPGKIEFIPAENGVAVTTRPSGLLIIGEMDHDDVVEESTGEKTSNGHDKQVTCPFCGYGPGAPTSVALHMRHVHKTNRTFSKTMAEMFPTGKYARAEAEHAATRKNGKRATSNLRFMTPDMAEQVG